MKSGTRIRHLAFILFLIPMLLPPPATASRSTDQDGSLPEQLVAVEGGREPDYAVVVEKRTQRLFLYEVEAGRFTEVFRAPCSTGEVPGAKERAGDKKTPEGVYFFTKEHSDRELAPIYGTRAFPIDYPNLIDRLAGRGGNAIWLHGTNKKLVPRDSNGCIAVQNKTVERLARYITLNRTPIIIVDKLAPGTAADRKREQKAVAGILDRWRSSLSRGTYHDYLSVYDSSYLPDLSWWQKWNRLRATLKREGVSFSVEVTGTEIFRYRDLYTVLFDQVVKTPFQEVFVGTRKLFMSRGPEGLRIVGDQDQIMADGFKDLVQGHALVAACRGLKKAGAEHEIAAMVDGWLEAWSSKDIDRYASYYSQDFRSQGGADLDAWIRYKSQLNHKYRFIRVTRKKKLTIERGKRKSTVSFVQTYASNAFKATGIKKLILKREGNQWKILREIFNQI